MKNTNLSKKKKKKKSLHLYNPIIYAGFYESIFIDKQKAPKRNTASIVGCLLYEANTW